MKLLYMIFYSEVNSFIYYILKDEDGRIKNQEVIQCDWNIITQRPHDSEFVVFKRN
jgi:hypothetical protein